MDKNEFEKMRSLIKTMSSISSLEIPALVLGLLALIPGVFDEALVGVSAFALLGAIAFGRHKLVANRTKIMEAIDEAFRKGELTQQEMNESIKALNTLTIEGGSGIKG